MSDRLETWRPAGEWRSGDRGVIDVWWCALTSSAESLAAKLAMLTAPELARAARFRREVDRVAYVVVRATLRARLGACLGLAPAAVPLTETARGKPVLRGAGPRWECNVSHSGGIGLVAVAWDRAVGIDVEAHRASIAVRDLGQAFLSPREHAALDLAPADERREWFFTVWTRKEAFLKAIGQGLSFPLEKFSVTVSPSEPPRIVEIEGEPDAEHRWRLWRIDAGPGYSASLAAAASSSETVMVRGWK